MVGERLSYTIDVPFAEEVATEVHARLVMERNGADANLGIRVLNDPVIGGHILELAEGFIRNDKDVLTGLPNAAGIEKEIYRMANELYRQPEKVQKQQSFGLLKIDVRNFKIFNDLFGWSDGDMYLQQTAKKVRAARENDVVGRLGGDDFIWFFTLPSDLVWDKKNVLKRTFMETPMIGRLLDAGNDLSKQAYTEYQWRYRADIATDPLKVKKALRLSHDYQGSLDWYSFGIGTFSVGGLFFTGDVLSRWYQKDKMRGNQELWKDLTIRLNKPVEYAKTIETNTSRMYLCSDNGNSFITFPKQG